MSTTCDVCDEHVPVEASLPCLHQACDDCWSDILQGSTSDAAKNQQQQTPANAETAGATALSGPPLRLTCPVCMEIFMLEHVLSMGESSTLGATASKTHGLETQKGAATTRQARKQKSNRPGRVPAVAECAEHAQPVRAVCAQCNVVVCMDCAFGKACFVETFAMALRSAQNTWLRCFVHLPVDLHNGHKFETDSKLAAAAIVGKPSQFLVSHLRQIALCSSLTVVFTPILHERVFMTRECERLTSLLAVLNERVADVRKAKRQHALLAAVTRNILDRLACIVQEQHETPAPAISASLMRISNQVAAINTAAKQVATLPRFSIRAPHVAELDGGQTILALKPSSGVSPRTVFPALVCPACESEFDAQWIFRLQALNVAEVNARPVFGVHLTPELTDVLYRFDHEWPMFYGVCFDENYRSADGAWFFSKKESYWFSDAQVVMTLRRQNSQAVLFVRGVFSLGSTDRYESFQSSVSLPACQIPSSDHYYACVCLDQFDYKVTLVGVAYRPSGAKFMFDDVIDKAKV